MLTLLGKEDKLGTIKIQIAFGDVEIGEEYEFSKTEMINGALYYRIVTDSGEWLYVNELHCELVVLVVDVPFRSLDHVT